MSTNESLFNYIVTPVGQRYNNEVEVEEGKNLILNTEIANHEYINRVAEVIQVPFGVGTPVRVGIRGSSASPGFSQVARREGQRKEHQIIYQRR